MDKLPREYNCAAFHKTVKTMEKLLSRAALYLIDNCDDRERTYARWRKSVEIKRDWPRKGFVTIRWKSARFSLVGTGALVGMDLRKAESETVADIVPDVVVNQKESSNTEWCNILDEFICDGEAGTSITVDELNLTEADIGFVKASCAGVGGIKIVELNESRIVVTKLL